MIQFYATLMTVLAGGKDELSARFAELLGVDGVGVQVTGPEGLTVSGLTTAEVGRRAFADGIELHELRSRTSGLEEVYFRLTAGQEQYAATSAEQGAV